MNTGFPENTVYLYHHTHWDREWYHGFRQYQVRLAQVLDELIATLEAEKISCFMLDGQTILLEDYAELRPQNLHKLYALIQQQKIELGPWYVMPDTFLSGGESIIRNLQIGIERAQALGCQRFTAYLPDSFGHAEDLPIIFNQFAIHTGIVWRGVRPQSPSLFVWRGRDGSALLIYPLKQGYFQNVLLDPTVSVQTRSMALEGILRTLTQAATDIEGWVLFPSGGDHLGIIRDVGFTALQAVCPNIQTTTPGRFLKILSERTQFSEKISSDGFSTDCSQPGSGSNSLSGFPFLEKTGMLMENGHAAPYLLPGVLSSRVYLKQQNRQLEHQLVRIVEPLVLMASALGQVTDPVYELALAWKLLLQNHPHDSLCGCSVDAVHRENEVRFESVRQITDVLSTQLKHHIASCLASPQEWILWNLGTRPFSGVVPFVETSPEAYPKGPHGPGFQVESVDTILKQDYLTDTQDVPLSDRLVYQRKGWLWAEAVPSLGWAVFPQGHATSKNLFSAPEVTLSQSPDFCLENGLLRVSVSVASGKIEVEDLRTQKIYASLGNLIDWPDQGDSYNSGPVFGQSCEVAVLKEIKPGLRGPLVGSLKIEYQFPKPELQKPHLENTGLKVQLELCLTAGSARLDWQINFTNTQPNHKLQVGFKSEETIRHVWAETHLGVTKRNFSKVLEDTPIWQIPPVEKGEEFIANTGAIQRFFRVADQLFITEGLSEYDIRGNCVYITLFRGFSSLSSAETGARGGQAGPPFETPEGQCMGRKFSLRFAWMPLVEEAVSDQWMSLAAEEANRFYGVVFAERGCSSISHGVNPVPSSKGSLISWENPAIVCSALYSLSGPDEHKSSVLRLINFSGDPQQVTLHTLKPEQQLQRVDFLHRPLPECFPQPVQQPLSFQPWQVQTIVLR